MYRPKQIKEVNKEVNKEEVNKEEVKKEEKDRLKYRELIKKCEYCKKGIMCPHHPY